MACSLGSAFNRDDLPELSASFETGFDPYPAGRLGGIAALLYVSSRRSEQNHTACLDNLPEVTYRQPVVLVCGDVPWTWQRGVAGADRDAWLLDPR